MEVLVRLVSEDSRLVWLKVQISATESAPNVLALLLDGSSATISVQATTL